MAAIDGVMETRLRQALDQRRRNVLRIQIARNDDRRAGRVAFRAGQNLFELFQPQWHVTAAFQVSVADHQRAPAEIQL
jgi:hypothetical protein